MKGDFERVLSDWVPTQQSEWENQESTDRKRTSGNQPSVLKCISVYDFPNCFQGLPRYFLVWPRSPFAAARCHVGALTRETNYLHLKIKFVSPAQCSFYFIDTDEMSRWNTPFRNSEKVVTYRKKCLACSETRYEAIKRIKTTFMFPVKKKSGPQTAPSARQNGKL